MKVNVLIAEDQRAVREDWKDFFGKKKSDVVVHYALSYDDVYGLIEDDDFKPNIAVLDHQLRDSTIKPEATGLDVAAFLRDKFSDKIIIIAASQYIKNQLYKGVNLHLEYSRFSVRIIHKGTSVVNVLDEFLENRITEIQKPSPLNDRIASNSKSIRNLIANLKPYINQNHPLLLTGKTGVGKKYIANILHSLDNEDEAETPFVEINCSDYKHSPEELSTALFESDNESQQGTLFISEVEMLPGNIQLRLSRLLREGKPPTATTGKKRIIACSCKDGVELRGLESFKPELYYAFKVFQIPGLSKRRGDIIPLAEDYLDQYYAGYKLDDEAKKILRFAVWTTNIDELFSTLDQAVTESPEIKSLTPELFFHLTKHIMDDDDDDKYGDICEKNRLKSVRFDNRARTVSINGGEPITPGSLRQYAYLWALVETNAPDSPYCNIVEPKNVVSSIIELEKKLRRPKDKADSLKPGMESKLSDPQSKLTSAIKEIKYKPLELILPESRDKRLALDGCDEIDLGARRLDSGKMNFASISKT